MNFCEPSICNKVKTLVCSFLWYNHKKTFEKVNRNFGKVVQPHSEKSPNLDFPHIIVSSNCSYPRIN